MPLPITKSRLCLFIQGKTYMLNVSVCSTLDSSGSFVLSLASFLAEVGKIYPETVYVGSFKDKNLRNGRSMTLKAPSHYIEIWCDYLFKMICEDNIMQVKEEVIIFASAQPQYLSYILQSGYFSELEGVKKEDNYKTMVVTLFNINWQPIAKESVRKIGIINLSASVTNTDKTKVKINVNGLFCGIFYQHGDKWTSYQILNNQIPKVQELLQYDTLMISGSTYSVNHMHPYIRELAVNLKQALNLSKRLKVIGFCFGHQLLSYIHGARVEKRQQARGLEHISIMSHQQGNLSYLTQLYSAGETKLKIYEFHSDYVVNVPEGFTCIGESNSCNTEMLVSHDKRMLTFQFHPEYLVEYIRMMEQRWASENSSFNGIHQDKYDLDEEHHTTAAIIRRTIRRFIDYEVQVN